MNAESERASLPDRVEAAALHPYTLEMIEGRARSALDATLSPELALSVVRRDVPVLIAEIRRLAVALAAADACEAERNPNTTDDEYGEQVGWRWRYVNYSPVSGSKNGLWRWAELADDPTESMKRDEDDMLEVVPVFARRPVSSEDVHREERT